jgi:hypothetical protein
MIRAMMGKGIIKSRVTLYKENIRLNLLVGNLLDLNIKVKHDYEEIKEKYDYAIQCNKTLLGGLRQDTHTYCDGHAMDDQ